MVFANDTQSSQKKEPISYVKSFSQGERGEAGKPGKDGANGDRGQPGRQGPIGDTGGSGIDVRFTFVII